uniref:thiomuracin/GE37468 family thiazolyl RiPP peptide n=1 Tax=Microbispora cellulosiformans TaxID=2614688 RepID=UPI00177A89B6|nr:thiomuracin/GE37468 family thiazolyl RiPP peptide [Microbispora cellulosiformans]
MAMHEEALNLDALDLDSLDVATVELPGSDLLVEAVTMGLGNTEVGASGAWTSRTSWLV